MTVSLSRVCPNYTRKARVKEIDGPENREPLMNSKYGISCKTASLRNLLKM